MENFERERDALLASYTGGKKLLLHSCCAPCSSAVLERLTRDFDVTVYFYNPNIDGAEEYALRSNEQKRLLTEAFCNVRLLSEPHRADEFVAVSAGFESEKEGGARCERCFRLRLRRTAEEARRGGFDFISTTLTLSPLKNAASINRIGAEEAARAGVVWLPGDFKKKDGYLRSVALSQKYGLYRQNFCGCRASKRNENGIGSAT